MTEQWTDERLNQLASLLDRTAQQQTVNTEAIAQLREEGAQVNQNIEMLVGAVNALISRSDDDRAVMQQVQTDMRGLQTENRRILERLEWHFIDEPGE
ncbi:MAG: hypothetical protein HC895_08235 [Leptolyngbyaceae cyanobacterium SM1_3_5]|nr:hypothetical protein [Leptolyngbyaceae cyanobacterium SM1_3_5]